MVNSSSSVPWRLSSAHTPIVMAGTKNSRIRVIAPFKRVQVGQVGAEEFAGPERGAGTQQQEDADKDVARRIGEIVDEVSLEYGTEDVGVHGFSRNDRVLGE